MKYYDIDKAQQLAAQNKDFVLGEHGAGRRHFEEFKLEVKGRGKSRKRKMELAPIISLLTEKDEAVIIIDPTGAELTPGDPMVRK